MYGCDGSAVPFVTFASGNFNELQVRPSGIETRKHVTLRLLHSVPCRIPSIPFRQLCV